MKNVINWFEIPATNLRRALSFYKTILGLDLRDTEMLGISMGFFPTDGTNVSGAIVQGEDYKPSTDGVTTYLIGGNGMFIDTEGNKMAVHSIN